LERCIRIHTIFVIFICKSLSCTATAKKVPIETLNMNTGHEKTTVMGYWKLFEGSGIHHSNTCLQLTHMYINGYFVLLFDVFADHSASEDHTFL
jgi:hypothetical protein